MMIESHENLLDNMSRFDKIEKRYLLYKKVIIYDSNLVDFELARYAD